MKNRFSTADRKINGKLYRYNEGYDIWVCENGWGFFREYYNKYEILDIGSYRLKRQEDKDGNIYVNTKDHGNIRADLLVALCFCPGKPRGEVMPVHKDGNKGNCCRWNLIWEENN